MIMYGFLMFGLGVTWLYSIQDKDYLDTPNQALEPVKSLPSILINDIELGSVRYYLKGDQILPIKIDGLLLKDSCVYIQQMESNEDVLNKIKVEQLWDMTHKIKIDPIDCLSYECIRVDSPSAINSAKATLIEKHRNINLQLNLSKTFETEEEAKQILLSKLDNQFDNDLQSLQDKYNKQLDTLI